MLMLCDLCRKHHKTLWFRWGPIVLNAPWKLRSNDDLRSRSDKDLPADGNLTAEGCTSSIVVLQVFAPTTPLHFLLSPWCWICFFLPPPSWSGLLVAAELLFSFPPSICGRAHVPPISTIDYCCCHAVSAPPEKHHLLCTFLRHPQILQNMAKMIPAVLPVCLLPWGPSWGGFTVEVSGSGSNNWEEGWSPLWRLGRGWKKRRLLWLND